jgi:glycine cleavage system H protein
MSDIPQDLRYSDDHEWLRMEDDLGVIGVTAYASGKMGDVVFVELPEVGSTISAGETFGVIESPKAMADLYAPVSGEVVEINTHLEDNPEFVSQDPYGAGWMLKVRLSDAAEANRLKDASAYAQHVAEG